MLVLTIIYYIVIYCFIYVILLYYNEVIEAKSYFRAEWQLIVTQVRNLEKTQHSFLAEQFLLTSDKQHQ